jgi:hypothetical protein
MRQRSGGVLEADASPSPIVPSMKTSNNEGSTFLNAWGRGRGKPAHISADFPAGSARAQNAKKICSNLARN